MRRVFRPVKTGWMAFVRWFGAVQMILLLTLTYFLMITFVYPFLRLFSDPLRMRAPKDSNWQPRPPQPDAMTYLNRQY